eukprot:m.144729 g.144729  ORF g.144729 m.144729 type:complete len:86 (+) comp14105_c0_seq2:925-1182(+)
MWKSEFLCAYQAVGMTQRALEVTVSSSTGQEFVQGILSHHVVCVSSDGWNHSVRSRHQKSDLMILHFPSFLVAIDDPIAKSVIPV